MSNEVKIPEEGMFNIPENGMIYMSAEWCSPCKMVKPFIKQFQEDGENVIKVDVDESPLMAEYFQVNSIPSFIAIKNGKEVDRVLGAQPKKVLQELLDKTRD